MTLVSELCAMPPQAHHNERMHRLAPLSNSVKAIALGLALSFPARADETTQEPQLPERPAPGEVESGSEEQPAVNSELAGLARRVMLGQVQYADLSREDLNQTAIIEACLKNPQTATELLCDLSADDVQQLVGYEQIFAEIKSLDTDKLTEMACFSDPRFLTSFDTLISSRQADLYQLNVLYPLATALRPPDSEKVGELCEVFIEQVLSSTCSPEELVTKVHLYVPTDLIAHSQFGDRLAAVLPFAPCKETVMTLVISGATPSTVVEHIKVAQLTDADLVRSITPRYLTPEFEDRIALFIHSKPRHFLSSVSTNKGLLLNERLQTEILQEIGKDISLAAALQPLDIDSPSAQAFENAMTATVREALTSRQLVDDICSSLRKDFANLKTLPVEVMEIAEIKHQARVCLNEFFREDKYLADEPSTAASIVHTFAKRLPDVALLLGKPEVVKKLSDFFPELVAMNPRSFHHVGFNLNDVSPAARDVYYNMLKAFEELGITGIGRFDSAVEILGTHMRIATPETRSRILGHLDNVDSALEVALSPPLNYRKLYSSAHTTSEDLSLIDKILAFRCMAALYPTRTEKPVSIRDLVESASTIPDERPLCVIISAKPTTDTNHAFTAHENLFPDYDFVDSLTTAYQVVYLEASSLADGANRATDACQALNKKFVLLPIFAHGSTNKQWSSFSPSLEPDPGLHDYRSRYGYDFFQPLADHVGRNAIVPLMSCSMAALGAESPASLVQRGLGDVTVIAPDQPTECGLLLKPNGTFKEVRFNQANAIAFSPNSKAGEVVAKPPWIGDIPPERWLNFAKVAAWEAWSSVGRAITILLAFNYLRSRFGRERKPTEKP